MIQVQTLVFPTDDSACAEAARPLAERLAERYGATLHVLRVEVAPPAGDLRLDPVSAPDTTSDGVVEARLQFPTAADAILLYADEVGADLVVMGTHGRSGIGRLTLGSTAERVLRQSSCAVLSVGPDADVSAAGPVLAPLAFESSSDLALETAVALAEDLGTHVVALHVVEPADVPVPYMMALPPVDAADLTARVERTLGRWVAGHVDGPVPVTTAARHGAAALEIVAAAREHGVGLVVQASHGRRGLGRWLLGSVAEGVVRRAPCPVLTLRVGTRPLVRTDGEAEARPVPRADWPALFEALSDRASRAPHTARVEVVSPEAEGVLYDGAPLLGVTYDERDDAVEVMVEGGEHHVVCPFAVRTAAGPWTLDAAGDDDAPGPWTLDVVRADGMRERITVQSAEPVSTDAR